MPVHVFFNPAAASGRAGMRLGVTLAKFRSLGVDVRLHRPQSASDARARMRDMAGTEDRIIVVGGDGMFHQAANALAGSGTVVGVIPAGTGNDGALSLGLTDDIDAACRAAMGAPAAIDLIESPHGVAVTVATAGFSVAVNDRADSLRRLRGATKYTLSSLIELPRLQTHAVTLVRDGVSEQIEASLIAVANTPYFGGGMKIAPQADPTDGLLDVVVIGPAPRRAFAAVLPSVFSGRHVDSEYVTIHRAAAVELAGAQLALRADGEDFGALPVTLAARRQALLVAGCKL